MSNQWQARRGTTAQNDAFTGASGEITYDTDSQGLRIHDGTKQGGYLVDTVVDFQKPTAENNYTWYRLYASGFVEQGGLTTIPSAKYIDITLPIPMQDNHYTPMVTASWSSSATGQNEGCDSTYKTNTTMRLAASYAGVIVWWQVSGMAA